MNDQYRDIDSVRTDHHLKGRSPMLLSTSTLLDNEVYNVKGENLGDIKEFMLDTNSGKICYAVLSFGGFLGMGEKLFAVPWSALTLDTEYKRFVLDVEVERLKSAPGFDKDDWPDMADATWARGISDYYGIKADRPTDAVTYV